jgi:NADPH2 dehydrogenase
MLNLFSPLTLGRIRLSNRIILHAAPSGYAASGGFADNALTTYYSNRAQGGAGMLVFEHTHVLPPSDPTIPHLGLYGDAQIAALRQSITTTRLHGSAVLVMLDQPIRIDSYDSSQLLELGEAFITAAWRACAANAQGIMLSTADGGPFEQLVSPLQNRRSDMYGRDIAGRLRLLLMVIEGIQKWLGDQFLIGVRLNVEEFVPGGLSLQDARVIAKRLIGAGVKFLEVTATSRADTPIAQFPGWLVPLAAGLKAVVEVPVLVGNLSDDPLLVDSVIRDGSADLVALNEVLRTNPLWPQEARMVLENNNDNRQSRLIF